MTSPSHQFISFSLPEARFFAQKAKRYNYDLFLASLMAPAKAQPSLQLILCVAHELERATRITSEPLLAMIRLTWWREAIEEIVAGSAPRAHELVQPLARLINAELRIAQCLLQMIEAQAMELEPEQLDMANGFTRYLQQGAGNMLRAWGYVLNEEMPEALGQAVGLLDIALKLPADAANGVVRIATEDCAAAGLGRDLQSLMEPSIELNFLCETLVERAKNQLPTAPQRKLLRALQQILQSRISHIKEYGCNPCDARIGRTSLSLYFSLLRRQIVG